MDTTIFCIQKLMKAVGKSILGPQRMLVSHGSLKLVHHVQYNRNKLSDVFQNYFTTGEGLHKYTKRQAIDY